MRRPLFAAAGVLLLVLGAVARLHNAWAAPVLAGYDSFGHFTYIWFLAETGRVPLATHGWSFFHPPLYYALMAALWDAMGAFDPAVRLKTGKVLVAALGLVHAAAAWHLVGRRFPAQPRARWMAAALGLLLPVQLYSAGFLGNEGLNAALCSLALLLLVAVMERPGLARAAALGFVLGLAMLAKFTSIVIVAAAVAGMLITGIVRREARRSAAGLVTMLAVMGLVCGWYYARNLAAHGTPFPLSRGTFAVAYVEDNLPRAERGWLEYLTFDPVIFRRPMWPRSVAPGGDEQPSPFSTAVRHSVWTGIYANAWFDGFGGWVLPPVNHSEASRRSGQALLTLGLLPTSLVLLGFGSALAGLVRRRDDHTTIAFAAATAAMVTLFVVGTREAPIAAAVKATYFLPVSVVFAYWFAHGLVRLERWRPRWTSGVDAACALLGALSLAVFWQGFVFDSRDLGQVMPHFSESVANQHGVMDYAGGRPARARRAFEQAAASNYHLAWENLAFLEIDEGRLGNGLRLLRRAEERQREQIDGGPVASDRFLELALAEYDHSIAVVLYRMGRGPRAIRRWERALRRDPTHAEARWCLALARLRTGLASAKDDGERRTAFDHAASALAEVRRQDPGLEEGWLASAAVHAARGDCEAARRTMDEMRALPFWMQRRYPAQTGTGAVLAASIGRRRLFAVWDGKPLPGAALAGCDVEVSARRLPWSPVPGPN